MCYNEFICGMECMHLKYQAALMVIMFYDSGPYFKGALLVLYS